MSTACNARPPEGHGFHGTMVACHMAKGHDGPHTWDHQPSLARLGLNRLLALMPTRELELVDNQTSPPLLVRDVRTGEVERTERFNGEPNPWVVVTFVGGDTYGIWKATGDVFRQLSDGSMDVDPMLTLAGEGLTEEERTELRRAPRPDSA